MFRFDVKYLLHFISDTFCQIFLLVVNWNRHTCQCFHLFPAAQLTAATCTVAAIFIPIFIPIFWVPVPASIDNRRISSQMISSKWPTKGHRYDTGLPFLGNRERYLRLSDTVDRPFWHERFVPSFQTMWCQDTLENYCLKFSNTRVLMLIVFWWRKTFL